MATTTRKRSTAKPRSKTAPKRPRPTVRRRADIIPRVIESVSDESTPFDPIIRGDAPAPVFPSATEPIFLGGTSYWEHRKDGRVMPQFNKGCFGTLDYANSEGITFLCTLPPAITDQIARFWLRFLTHVLRDIPWSAQLCTANLHGHPNNRCILYRLPKMVSNVRTNTVYLTLFREPSMQAPVVAALYADRAKAGDSPDQLFRLFQEIHRTTGEYSKVLKTGGHNSCNPLAPQYDGQIKGESRNQYSSWVPVSIATFRENVRSGKIPWVYGHYREYPKG